MAREAGRATGSERSIKEGIRSAKVMFVFSCCCVCVRELISGKMRSSGSTSPCRGSQEDSATLHGHIWANTVNEHEDPVETRPSVGGVLASVDDAVAKKDNVVNRS
jgi:hypothetical protein